MTFLLSATIKIALPRSSRSPPQPCCVDVRRRWALGAGNRALRCLIPALELFMPAWSIPLPVAGPRHRRVRHTSGQRTESPREPSRTTGADAAQVSRLDGLPSAAIVFASVWIAGVVVGGDVSRGIVRLQHSRPNRALVSAGPWRVSPMTSPADMDSADTFGCSHAGIQRCSRRGAW